MVKHVAAHHNTDVLVLDAYTFAMVKLTSFIAFSALVFLPTFAAVIPIIETSVLIFFCVLSRLINVDL